MSNLSDIGFRVESVEDFERIASEAAKSGQVLESRQGYYIRWAPGAGVELWAQANRKRELIGCNPHFEGSSRIRLGVTELIPSEDAPMDGSLRGWANPPENDPQNGEYPLTVDAPDFDIMRDQVKIPSIVTVQVAGFAHELTCYADDEDFMARQPHDDSAQGHPFNWAAESFMPLTATDAEGKQQRPEARALFAGHVMEAELRTNPVTELQFYWLSVQTLGGRFDVVADPEIVKSEPAVGGIVHGMFWMSGRVTAGLSEERRSFWSRFGRNR